MTFLSSSNNNNNNNNSRNNNNTSNNNTKIVDNILLSSSFHPRPPPRRIRPREASKTTCTMLMSALLLLLSSNTGHCQTTTTTINNNLRRAQKQQQQPITSTTTNKSKNNERKILSQDDAMPIKNIHYKEGPFTLMKQGLLRNHAEQQQTKVVAKEQQQQEHYDPLQAFALASSASISTDLHQQQTKKQLQAIVHIGPHKTATTSIQALTAILHNDIVNDGYEMPWGLVAKNLLRVNDEPYIDINQFNLVSCLQGNHKELWPEAKCNPALLDATKQIAKKQQNLILSAEEFSRTNIVQIDQLQQLLHPFDNVRIVAYYRRFYDWLFSYWQQFAKYQNIQYRKSFPTYVSDMNMIQNLHNSTYTVGSMNAYKQYFHDVVVYNMHNMGQYKDVSEIFFCEAVPGTSKTCEKVKERNKREHIEFNTGYPLVYEELAWHAEQLQLWNRTLSGKDMKDITKLTRERHEKQFKLGQYDFDGYIICPSEESLNYLLQTTLDDEKLLFPEYYASPDGEEMIRTKFMKDSKTKLCSVDAKRVIEENHNEWKTFFQSI